MKPVKDNPYLRQASLGNISPFSTYALIRSCVDALEMLMITISHRPLELRGKNGRLGMLHLLYACIHAYIHTNSLLVQYIYEIVFY